MIKIEFLWFEGCPSHVDARALLRDVLAERGIRDPIEDIEATDPRIAKQYRFAGSPTIRINGRDVEPGFADPGDYTPRCRLYPTSSGLQGVPERGWVQAAVDEAQGPGSGDQHV